MNYWLLWYHCDMQTNLNFHTQKWITLTRLWQYKPCQRTFRILPGNTDGSRTRLEHDRPDLSSVRGSSSNTRRSHNSSCCYVTWTTSSLPWSMTHNVDTDYLKFHPSIHDKKSQAGSECMSTFQKTNQVDLFSGLFSKTPHPHLTKT